MEIPIIIRMPNKHKYMSPLIKSRNLQNYKELGIKSM